MGKKKPSGSQTSSSSSKKIIIYAIIGIVAVAAVAATVFRTPVNPPSEFEQRVCGLDAQPNSNNYIREFALPGECEMPLAITYDGQKVWYISTKQGTLGSFDQSDNKFEKYTIPVWQARSDPAGFSMSWDMEQDGKGNIWFTDFNNAIWKFKEGTGEFEMFESPAGQPVDIDFDSNGNIYLAGIRSKSLWFGDVDKMKDGTSDGMSEIKMPLEAFSGIDPFEISSGSVAVDSERDSVWFSMLAFNKKGEIFHYRPSTGEIVQFDLPEQMASPVGLEIDSSGNPIGTDHGTNIFFKLDRETGEVTGYSTSVASPVIYGGETPKNAYTLPYWVERNDDGSIWFNEHTGNKIAKFDTSSGVLVEYWVPSQNKHFAPCPPDAKTCGIANVLQFSASNGQVWFTEWSENKIGKLDAQKQLPFSVSTSVNEITVRKGESKEIIVNVEGSANSGIKMISSGTFTQLGELGNNMGIYSQESVSVEPSKTKSVSFTFTPSSDLGEGRYTLMLGAETNEVSIMKAITVNVV